MRGTLKLTQLMALLILTLSFVRCGQNAINDPAGKGINYRGEMRDFVIALSDYAKSFNSDFLIIPQNGQELLTDNGEANGILQTDYLHAIDATGRESMFYGYHNDDRKTPLKDKEHLLNLCLLCEHHSIEVLSTDYVSTHRKMDESFAINAQHGFISFSASERELNDIPDYPGTPFNENKSDITSISQARNFLYLINTANFATKRDFIHAVSSTNYDLIIMDLYHNEKSYTSAEIDQLKTKLNGGARLIVCYMSIGEAEDYRYYWQTDWRVGNPSWLDNEDPNWRGNYYVRYWDVNWQNIVFGNDNSYLKKIVDAGFDGVYLDLVDAYEYYEE